ncbi:MAG: GNAT family N-acetyltransferase [Chloroflexi bacterium]|nr:GNAT family N-acetyltransferase [Chloroflexota bacterium]
MVVSASTNAQSKQGLRPININKDIPQVIDLLKICFGNSMGYDGQQIYMGSPGATQSPALLWRLSPAATKLALGYVWEENGRIVGNVTALTTKIPGRYLVVNVATHPDYRRHGIAFKMMAAIKGLVQQRNGNQILLQVVKENEAAVNLYNRLQYTSLGSITTWFAAAGQLRRIEPTFDGSQDPYIRELRRSEWRQAYELDVLALHPNLNWPEPLPQDAYQKGWLRRITNFVNGRQAETWVVTHQNKLIGLGTILTEWGRIHATTIRIHPEWHGQLERPLLSKLTRRIQYMPRRNIRIDYPDHNNTMNNLLREANFQPKRTLTHMLLDI